MTGTMERWRHEGNPNSGTDPYMTLTGGGRRWKRSKPPRQSKSHWDNLDWQTQLKDLMFSHEHSCGD
jgi:hypothetical protein